MARTEPTAESSIPATSEEIVPATLVTGDAPASPNKRDSKVKSWFKSHMRGPSKSQKEDSLPAMTTGPSEDVDRARDSSIRDVAMAGRETGDMYGAGEEGAAPVSPIRATEADRASSSLSISSYSSQEETSGAKRPEGTTQSGRKGLKQRLLNKIKPGKEESGSQPANNVTDDEEFQEAKDKFEEDTLAPPSVPSNRPASPRLSHDRSKFTEEL